jgi:hypothetical protein
LEIVKIIRETEKEEFEVNEGGVLFATKSCTIKGNLYSAGPIIALGDLKIEGKIISEISIMVAKTLQAQHSISACFIMASNIKCKGIVQAPVPLNMRRILWRPFRFPLNEICQLREKGDLGKISVWGKITAGGICGVIIQCEKEILSFGRVEANSKIECGKNIISKRDIIAGVPFIQSIQELQLSQSLIPGDLLKAEATYFLKGTLSQEIIFELME